MIKIRIDGQEVEVEEGQTVLDGARKLGIDIPTLCYLERCGPMTSCLVCVVKLTVNGRSSIVPSCGVKATPGMVIESETQEVHALRRSALELLLSDHVGDCLSPCSRICPLELNIPQMLRQVQLGRLVEASTTLRDALALPSVLGRLCHRPCENGCRRGSCDSAAAIRDVELFVAEENRKRDAPCLPPVRPASGRRVVVVGSGPVGLQAGYDLVRAGHECVVIDRNTTPGGSLKTEVEAGRLPAEVLEAELRDLRRMGIEFRTRVEVGRDVSISRLLEEFEAVLMATGAAPPGDAEIHGLAVNPTGITVAPAETFQTSRSGVFAAGNSVRPVKQLVKAMAEGQAAAHAVGEFLAGRDVRKPRKPFSSMMGRLDAGELALFKRSANPGPRVAPGRSAIGGYDAREAAEESSRCLHCDCRAAGNCRLQHYSQVYGAEFGRYARQRRGFEQHRHRGGVFFEPGKCILCGICIRIASEAAEPLGLTFVGRGFEVRVEAPLGEEFESGLQKVAMECVEACPTGAIEVKDPTDAG